MRTQSDGLFEISCIPFYAYGLSFGDILAASFDPLHGMNAVVAVFAKSGHRTMRVALHSTPEGVERDALRTFVMSEVRKMGGEVEIYSGIFLSIDAPTEDVFQEVRRELAELESAGRLEYQEADI